MTRLLVSRLGGFFTILLLVAGLALLQILIGGKELAFSLPSYGLIAIAALIAFFTLKSDSRADLLCLSASALFFGYVAIRAITSPASYFARPDLYLALAAFTIYGLTAIALSASARRITLIVALLVVAVLHVFVGLVQFGLGENFKLVPYLEDLSGMQRASGFYANPDHLAGLLEILGIFGLSITCWSRWPKWSRVVFGYLTVMCYIGLAMTGSRGGYVSAAVSLLVFVVLSLVALRSAGKTFLLRFAAAALVALVIAFVAAGLLIRQNAQVRGHVEKVALVDNTRFDLWRAAIEQWKLQPLVGTGGGTYRFYGRQFRSVRMQNDPLYVHNDYLHLLCEYGLLGFAGFIVFLYAHLRRGWQTFVFLGPRRLEAGSFFLSDRFALNLGALGAIAAYAVHSLVDFNLHIPANAVLLAFAFGVLANPGLKIDSESSPRVAPMIVTALVAAILLIQSGRLWPGEYFGLRARIALENEEPAQAVTLARKALRYERHNPTIFFHLGRALLALQHKTGRAKSTASSVEEALAAFQQAHRLAPLDGTFPLDLALVYDELGRYREAEWMYGVARGRDPRSRALSQLYQSHLQAWRNAGPAPATGQ